ncbi:MAG: YbjN domain-containing protein [Candidatus Competibacterales bacterium]|nr:YbjN domain-containing protein [Candidatus Competibacterales bacterium]
MHRALPALLAALASGPALTQNLIDATDPEAILNVATGFGSASLSRDNLGDPYIEGRIEGRIYELFFYDCTDNANCRSLMFRASFDAEGYTVEHMNLWNKEQRFGKAYLNEAGDPVIEYDVNLYGGVTFTNFDDTFDWWRIVLDKFAGYVKY